MKSWEERKALGRNQLALSYLALLLLSKSAVIQALNTSSKSNSYLGE